MSTDTVRRPFGASDLEVSGAARRIARALGRILGISGTEDLITYLLLGAMASIVAVSVQLADWGESPTLAWTVLAGAALGVAFARPIGPWPLRHAAGLLFGVAFAIWQVSGDADGGNVAARWLDTWDRVGIWIDAARADGISNDPLPFGVFLTVFAWVVAYASGWSLFKWRSPWPPTLILGLSILTNLSYRFGKFEYTFLAFAMLAIALFAHMAAVNTRRRWDRAGITYTHGVKFEGIAAAVVTGVFVVAIAAVLPLIKPRSDFLDAAWSAAKDPWRNRLQERAIKLFPNVGGRNDGRLRAFDTVLAFKGPIRFDGDTVFFVKTRYESLNPARAYSVYTPQGWLAGPVSEVKHSAEESVPIEGTLLERIAVEQVISAAGKVDFTIPGDYALELGRDYISEELPLLEVQINMVQGELDLNLPVDVRTYADALRDVFVYADPPQGVEPDAVARKLLPPNLELIESKSRGNELKSVRVRRKGGPVFDQLAVRLADPAEAGETVSVRRLISQATDQQLNAAGEDYPLWVTDRYLQLPDTLPGEVKALADSIVENAGAVTPLEKADAISEHLRGFSYSQDIQGPDADQDGVSYFLFDTASEPCGRAAEYGPGCEDSSPKGYSSYFGSSLAVMLRTQGVPARMVSGYKAGTFDASRGGFTIQDLDSHGWAQAFFPGYGWIDLEATPGEPLPVRGALSDRTAPGFGGLDTLAPGLDPFGEVGEQEQGTGPGPDLDTLLGLTGGGESGSSTPIWPFAAAFAALAGIMGSIVAWRWRFWAMSPTRRAYVSMSRWGRLAGVGRRSWETPMEYALRLGESARDGDEAGQAVARAYELEMYSGRPVPEEVTEATMSEWPSVRWALIRRALVRPFGVKPRPPLRVRLAEPVARPLYSRLPEHLEQPESPEPESGKGPEGPPVLLG